MTDKDLIISLGGPAEVARILGYGKWGTNRVCNWLKRGIPPSVKLARPDIFLGAKPPKKAKAAHATKEPSHA